MSYLEVPIGLALAAMMVGCGGDSGRDWAAGDEPSARGEDPVEATAALVTIPAGFAAVALAPPNKGIHVYKRNGEWLTVVDFRQASSHILTGPVTIPPNDPKHGLVQKRQASVFWPEAVAYNPRAKVVVSGTFGSPWDNPAGIAFGLQSGGKLISLGYAAPGGPQPEFSGLVKAITFNNGSKRAYIGPYLSTSFSSPDLVGALDVTANKGSLSSVGRTFVGVRDDDADGNFETMLVYSSGAATQPQAASVLTASGAQQQAMLDGSGSTFLVVDGVTRIPTDGRLVPQAIAFYGSY